MVHDKNYEAVSTFVKVMQKKTVASFFQTRYICVASKDKMTVASCTAT